MAYTNEDLNSANAKLATLDFSQDEKEAVAAFLSGDADEVAGFGYDPNKQGDGFLLEVAGLVGFGGWAKDGDGFVIHGDLTNFTATDDLWKK